MRTGLSNFRARRQAGVRVPEMREWRWKTSCGNRTPAPCGTAIFSRFLSRHGLADFAALEERALDDPHWFWDAVIGHHGIRFSRPYERVLDLSDGVAWPRRCVGGRTSLAVNCLDRNLKLGRGGDAAIVWEGEDGTVRRWTYAELAAKSARCAADLRALGLGQGDVVGI